MTCTSGIASRVYSLKIPCSAVHTSQVIEKGSAVHCVSAYEGDAETLAKSLDLR